MCRCYSARQVTSLWLGQTDTFTSNPRLILFSNVTYNPGQFIVISHPIKFRYIALILLLPFNFDLDDWLVLRFSQLGFVFAVRAAKVPAGLRVSERVLVNVYEVVEGVWQHLRCHA